MAGIYIHIPFCKRLCHYCDFHFSVSLQRKPEMVEALLREMELQRGFLEGEPVETLYIGGGTPTVLSPAEIGRLADRVRETWDVKAFAEFTVEANPDDLTDVYLEGLARTGAGRLSIGIQSFIDRDLRTMNRRHTADQARRAVRRAKAAGFENITVDLIYGIPGMTSGEWAYNLEQTLALDVPHVSAYHLTFEDRTVFGKKRLRGLLSPVAEEESERQYALLEDVLGRAGYEHYEVSNFARPGHRAVHNSNYWRQLPYLGIGPSAHSYRGKVRRWNVSSNRLYLEGLEKGTYCEQEALDENALYNEYVMTGLRTAEGIGLKALSDRFGPARTEYLLKRADRFLGTGRLERQGERLFIPTRYFLLSDYVIAELFAV